LLEYCISISATQAFLAVCIGLVPKFSISLHICSHNEDLPLWTPPRAWELGGLNGGNTKCDYHALLCIAFWWKIRIMLIHCIVSINDSSTMSFSSR
jgi:hypothetical protein